MTGRKHRPVLYEVVRRSRMNASADPRRVATPAPVSRAPDVAENGAGEPDGDGQYELAVMEAPAAPAAPNGPRGESWFNRATSRLPAWTAWLAEGRMHLTFGWIGASVVGVALVLVLFVTFQAGMRFASPTAPVQRETPTKPDTAAN